MENIDSAILLSTLKLVLYCKSTKSRHIVFPHNMVSGTVIKMIICTTEYSNVKHFCILIFPNRLK